VTRDHLIEKSQVDWSVFCTKFEIARLCDCTLYPAHNTNRYYREPTNIR